MSTKDGGPAFPNEWAPNGGSPTQGMSLRDWFAGRAMELARDDLLLAGRNPYPNDILALAYEYADAALAARTKPEGT